jgi:hypothetical protein
VCGVHLARVAPTHSPWPTLAAATASHTSSSSPHPLNAVSSSPLCVTAALAGMRTRTRTLVQDENEVAEVVIVCEPEGATLTMGGLHPR